MKTRSVVDAEYGSPLSIVEIELPDPGPSEVRVRLFASGICHSQLHTIHDPNAPRPALMGHEATGVIEAAGSDVTHVREGDHVMVTWIPRDITPDVPAFTRSRSLLNGEPPANAGVFTWAEHTLVHEQMVVPLPKNEPTDVTAIIGCAVMTGVGAVVGSANVQPGQTVAVFGVGGVGINCIAGAKIAGASQIIAVDLVDEKLEFAKEFGATDVVNASTTNAVEAIHELSNGGVDFAFDAIGNILQQCLEATRPGVWGAVRGGTAVAVGINLEPIVLPGNMFPGRERALIGATGGSARPMTAFQDYLRWFREGQLPLDRMVTVSYEGLDSIHEAVRALENREINGRSIMVYERP
jgi:Zn-dependent alcohol dehydrogenase